MTGLIVVSSHGKPCCAAWLASRSRLAILRSSHGKPCCAAWLASRSRLALPSIRSVAALFALSLLGLPSLASADGFSFLGAETLAPGSTAAYVTVGVPDAEIGVGFGLNSIADVTPRLRLQYGRGTRLGGAGVAVGATLRMKVARARRWTIALVAEPEVSLHLWGNDVPPTTTTGSHSFAISPFAAGVVADRVVLPDVRVIAGIKAPLTFYLRPEWVLNVPLIVELGVEAKLADRIHVLARIDAGADFYGPGGLPGAESYFRVRVGLGWSRE